MDGEARRVVESASAALDAIERFLPNGERIEPEEIGDLHNSLVMLGDWTILKGDHTFQIELV